MKITEKNQDQPSVSPFSNRDTLVRIPRMTATYSDPWRPVSLYLS
jgi:hypothetical protein